METPDWLPIAARHAREQPWTLGYLLERYRELEGRSIEQLAEELGCDAATLDWLALCRRPAGDKLEERVQEIAARYGLAPAPLAAVVRRVEVIQTMSSRSQGSEIEPALRAARDQDEEPEE